MSETETTPARGRSPRSAPDRDTSWLDRPVFVTGLMKTGSTLLLSLLDGHPDVLVYPDEPSFDRIFRKRYRSPSELAADWLYGTPNPLHFGPALEAELAAAGHRLKSWKPVPEAFSPSAERIRGLRESIRLRGLSETDQRAVFDPVAYHERLADALESGAAESPREVVRATMKALVASLSDAPAPKKWLFKHPQTRFCADTIAWFDEAFPEGQLVVLIRDPRGFVNSLLAYDLKRRSGPQAKWRRVAFLLRRLGTLERDYLAYEELEAQLGADRVALVKYEDLISDTDSTMRRLAEHLGVPFDEALTRPTKLGRAVQVPTATRAEGSAVYKDAVDKWKRQLAGWQVLLIETALDGYFRREEASYRPTTSALPRRMLRPAVSTALRIIGGALDLARPRRAPATGGADVP